MTRQSKQVLKKATGMYTTEKEAVTTIIDNDTLVAIIYKDMRSRKTLMFSCKEMDADDIADMLSKIQKPQLPTLSFRGFGPLETGASLKVLETVDDTLPDNDE